MPTTFKTTFKYFDSLQLSPGAGTTNAVRYRTNGPFDPLFDFGGTQPRGWDQISPMYERYTVIGCRIEATFTPVNASVINTICGVAIRSSGTTDNLTGFMEGGYNKYITLQAQQAGLDRNKIVVNLAPHKFLGVADPISDPNYTPAINATPVNEAIAHVWASAQDGISNPSNIDVIIMISYMIIFSSPVQPPQSV